MAENEPIADGIDIGPGATIPESGLRFQFARSSGPGGQNVNKLNTKAELWIDPQAIRSLPPDALDRLKTLAGKRLTNEGEIHLTAETARTQESNRLAVLEKLRELIVQALHRPKRRRKTRPSASSRRKRLESKRHRGEIKAQRRSHGAD